MEIKEQTKKMKEMINGYKLTYLIMSANNIGLLNILDDKGKTLTQIAMELSLEEDRIEPILNGLTFHKMISKNKDSYYLEYSITVAKKYENVTAKMVDLPEMVKIQNKRIHQEGLEERLTSEIYDYNINFPTGNYDDVFLFAVVHQEPEEHIRKLLDNIYTVLKPNGRLFLTSFFLNEDKISPEYSVQFAIEMLINTEKGKAYTHNEIQSLIKKSQFKEIERVDEIPGPATLYIAKK